MQNYQSLCTITINEEIQEQKETAQKKKLEEVVSKKSTGNSTLLKEILKEKSQANYRFEKDKQWKEKFKKQGFIFLNENE